MCVCDALYIVTELLGFTRDMCPPYLCPEGVIGNCEGQCQLYPPVHCLIQVLVTVGCHDDDALVLLNLGEHDPEGGVGAMVPGLKQRLTLVEEENSVVDLGLAEEEAQELLTDVLL